MTLIDHLERFLGPLTGGWNPKPESGIQIARFANRPFPGASTYVTAGLSRHILSQPTGTGVRLELMYLLWDDEDAEHVVPLLGNFAELVVRRHEAPPHGTVASIAPTLWPRARMGGVYLSQPVVFPDALAVYEGPAPPPTVLVWLIPILPQEVEFVDARGWRAFEERLEAKDPDLLDLGREAVADWVVDMYASSVRSRGDLGGVFEFVDGAGHFYLYDQSRKEGARIVEAIHIASGIVDFSESDVAIAWSPDEEVVGLFIRGTLWAAFRDGKGFGGEYRRGSSPSIPSEVTAAFART